jgi:hypothetical protein
MEADEMKASSCCGKCGKGLTNPVSIATGFGPQCRIQLKISAKQHDELGDLFMLEHAKFKYALHGDVLVILDLNEGKSVTNDIEWVLAEIFSTSLKPTLLHGVIYQDSMGVFDLVQINQKGLFCAFVSVNEMTIGPALEKVHAMKETIFPYKG